MSQEFKFNFNRAEKENSQDQEREDYLYKTEGNVRNISFEWPDGRKKFLNYAYLISCEFEPENGVLELMFTSEKVVIEGERLGILFHNLSRQTPAVIKCIEERYGFPDSDYVIYRITIT